MINSQPPSVIHFSTNFVFSIVLKSEKLSDILQYEGDKNQLDAWEQNLIQRMNVNYDRYLIAYTKIAYAKSRLTIEKKIYNFIK